jgi:hypothetical protein
MCLVSSLWFSFFAKLFEIKKKLIFKNLNMPNVFLSLSFMPYGTTQTCFFKLIQIMFYRIFKILDALKPVHPPTHPRWLSMTQWPVRPGSDLGQTWVRLTSWGQQCPWATKQSRKSNLNILNICLWPSAKNILI